MQYNVTIGGLTYAIPALIKSKLHLLPLWQVVTPHGLPPSIASTSLSSHPPPMQPVAPYPPPSLPPSPSPPELPPAEQTEAQQHQQQHQQQLAAPNSALIKRGKEGLKLLETALYDGDAHLVVCKIEEALQAVAPTLPSSQFAQQQSTAAMSAANRRMRREPMGASQPSSRRYASAKKKPGKKLWEGVAKQPGRKKGATKPAIPKLPKQSARRLIGSAVMRGVATRK